MEILAALPRDIWERTPPEAQAYIGTLEARVATLEDMVRTLQEQLIRRSLSVQHAHEVSAVVGGNRAIPARRAPWYLWKTLMRWSSSNPSSVAVATRPYRATIRRRFVIK